MLSWGRGGRSAGSSKPMPLACHSLPPAPAYSSGEEAASDSETQGALLAGTSALARRRHAIRFKRKSKIVYRIIRDEQEGSKENKTMEENRTSISHIKLEGVSNWNVWKFQSKILLRSQDLLDVVQGTRVIPKELAEKAKWEKLDAKAQTWLVTRMSESVMTHILTCNTSAEMWRKLCSIYEQTSETTIHIVQQRFFQYKYEDGTDMSTFLSKIEELKNQLKQMGENISERFVITKVLMSLPVKYQHFISAWESASEDKQTYDNLVARLLIEEERLKDKEEVPQQSAAFVAKKMERKNIKCFKCQYVGHLQSECKSGQCNNENRNTYRSDTREKPWKKCYYCRKSGHTKSECWFRKDKDNNAGNAFVVQSNEHYKQLQWLVDTGASQHMCRDRDLFATYYPLTNKSVIIGNGQAISAHGIGRVALQVHDGRQWIDTTIDNVLYVPELKTNLFSVTCVTAKGYVMKIDNEKCKIYKQTKLCAVGERSGDMYYMNFRYECVEANITHVQQLVMIDNDEVGEDKVSSEEKVNEISKQSNKRVEQKKVRQILEGTEETSELCTDSDMSIYAPCSSDEVCSSEEYRTPRRRTRVRKTSFYKCNCVSTQENEPNRIRDAMKRQKENDAEITKKRIKKCFGNVQYKVRLKI
uniref:CCHC-type domain-containing protein n=1 Tax=Heliothis virescens TaxID=7102 RepID=A0A2A4JP38_HELVI